MKHLILVCGGAADQPLEVLDGRTPLMAAATPHLDFFARHGQAGRVPLIPPEWEVGSDLACLGLLGYDPGRDYTGRGPLEWRGMGGNLGAWEAAFRVELLSSQGETVTHHYPPDPTPAEAEQLFSLLSEKLRTKVLTLYPVRHRQGLACWERASLDGAISPPHAIVGRPLKEVLPTGDWEGPLGRLIYNSLELLDAHPVNRRRREREQAPLNLLWPWGGGYPPRLNMFTFEHGWVGAAVAATPAVRGVARHAGLAVPKGLDVTAHSAGALRAKAERALALLERCDLVLLHLHAADEAGHAGEPEQKVQVLERIDEQVVGTIRRAWAGRTDCKLLIVVDYPCPVATREHVRQLAFFTLYAPWRRAKGIEEFSEPGMEEAALEVDSGAELLDLLKR